MTTTASPPSPATWNLASPATASYPEASVASPPSPALDLPISWIPASFAGSPLGMTPISSCTGSLSSLCFFGGFRGVYLINGIFFPGKYLVHIFSVTKQGFRAKIISFHNLYRGDTPFCSEDCRQEQIEIDEAKEKKWRRSSSAAMKALRKKDQQRRRSASPNKSSPPPDYPFRAGTVAAA